MTPSALANGAARNGKHRAAPAPSVRVAAYTRKSTDENLHLAFNSIDAQRECVANYVASQRSEGWVLLPERFDDGGYSGGNANRPALKRLLALVEARQVDVIAVYKLDRLARNQLDLLQMLAFLDRHGASFVSVTQPFETRTPMGRFGLQMMGCVAELERAQISERTRDKIAATRRRGMWTGGRPPLGYDVVEGALAVNADEAERVREIFRLYLELGSLGRTAGELRRRGWTSKSWTTKEGRAIAGTPLDKNRLRLLLGNALYRGQQRLGQETFAGQHEAIVDEPTWKAVQARLAVVGRTGRAGRAHVASEALLAGILRCGRCGAAMGHTHASRHGRKYRYYTCRTVQTRGAKACPGGRVSAGQIEGFVVEKIAAMGEDAALQRATAEALRAQGEDVDEGALREALVRFTPVWEALFPAERARVLRELVEHIRYDAAEGRVDVAYRPAGIRALAAEARRR